MTAKLSISTSILLALSLAATVPAFASTDAPAAVAAPARTLQDPARASEAYGALPIAFEAAVDSSALYVARSSGHALELGDDEATFICPDGAVRMRFGRAAGVAAEERLAGVNNYLIGNDPSKWRLGVETFAQVRYTSVAPGVDLVFHGTNDVPEYDFIVAPGADPASVEVEFDATGHLDENGDLVIAMANGELRQPRPVIYQETGNGRVSVSGGYRLEGRRVRFDVGAYDTSLPLVIDPAYKYGTYLGGNGDDRTEDAAVDSNGNIIIVGSTLSSNFPIQDQLLPNQSGMDGFVTKINATGTAFAFSTYIGGSGTDFLNGVDIDSSGRIFVTGGTGSNNYPVENAYDGNLIDDGLDAVLTVLNSAGSAITYSTLIGAGNNDIGNAVAVDLHGNAFIAGEVLDFDGIFSQNWPTKSPSSLDPFQKRFGGGRSDAFVCKFDPEQSGNASLVYSTLLGGEEGEGVEDIAVDEFERAYVCGYTESPDFPRLNAIQNTYGGGLTDGFVTKFNADGTTIFYSTFHGGSAVDEAFGIDLDTSGTTNQPVVVGHSTSTNLPTQLALQFSKSGPEDAFVLKLNDAGTSRVYATYFGGPGNDAAKDVFVDDAGNAYFTGFSNNTYPLLKPVPVNGIVNTSGATMTKLSPTGTLLQSTCVSSGSGEGIGLDAAKNIYVAGTTSVTNFPVTAGVVQTTFHGAPNDCFAFKLDVIDDVTIGVFKPGTRVFNLRDSNTSGGVETTATFGVAGDKPITGDWNGDETDTIGVYSPSTSTFSLRNTNTTGAADITFVFGAPNSIPLAGDWNGDGVDTIGVFDQATGSFFLRNTNSAGAADIVFTFGAGGAGVTPLAGDWNGDGTDTIGFYVASTREFFLKNTNAGGNADLQFVFGPTIAVPVVGDWNLDGVDTIGAFSKASPALPPMKFSLRNSNSAGATDITAFFGVFGDIPVTGNWDGQ